MFDNPSSFSIKDQSNNFKMEPKFGTFKDINSQSRVQEGITIINSKKHQSKI